MVHRGLISQSGAENSRQALLGALKAGLSVELDIRDQQGAVCISHDPPLAGNVLRLDDFLPEALALVAPESKQRIGLNVKSDGLVNLLLPMNEMLKSDAVFFFDMSVPQVAQYLNSGLNVALRVSEVEAPSIYGAAFGNWPSQRGFWCDSLGDDWRRVRRKWHAAGGQRFIVSPDLHGRDVVPVWKWFRRQVELGSDLILCTDLIAEARAFFQIEGFSTLVDDSWQW